MSDHIDGEPLLGGLVSSPVRIQGDVHREAGPWTPTVHALLRHLEFAGFEGAPRVVGFDEAGREVLTYVEGDAGSLQFPQALQHEHGVRALGRFIREFHDAVAGFVPASGAVYRIGARPLGASEIVCHGDLGYWNTIWRGDDVVALIDWDCAEPDAPLRDVAFAAMTTVPMHADGSAERSGFRLPLDRRARLRAFCTGYGGIEPAEVVQGAMDSLALEIERLRVFGAEGREPWASFLERGQGRMFETVAAWIAENRDSLV
ncbi:MAG TPA: phosphotransferase [Gaiellaceae bacterium]|nr:phosphotransferase [Gaiellaceae bacterium]